MKKKILLFMLGVFGLSLSSVNASFTIINDDGPYSPEELKFYNYTLSSNSFSSSTCSEEGCCIGFEGDGYYSELTYYGGNYDFTVYQGTFNNNGVYSAIPCETYNEIPFFDSITLNTTSSSVICDNAGLDLENQTDEENSLYCSSRPLPGHSDNPGESEGDLTGDNSLISSAGVIITGLNNTILEFIPYVVYIGLGILALVIGFVAIKWLINFVRNKILTPFK